MSVSHVVNPSYYNTKNTFVEDIIMKSNYKYILPTLSKCIYNLSLEVKI